MASITIHDVEEALQSRLRVRAGAHEWSVENEACDILVSALGGGTGRAGGVDPGEVRINGGRGHVGCSARVDAGGARGDAGGGRVRVP